MRFCRGHLIVLDSEIEQYEKINAKHGKKEISEDSEYFSESSVSHSHSEKGKTSPKAAIKKELSKGVSKKLQKVDTNQNDNIDFKQNIINILSKVGEKKAQSSSNVHESGKNLESPSKAPSASSPTSKQEIRPMNVINVLHSILQHSQVTNKINRLEALKK